MSEIYASLYDQNFTTPRLEIVNKCVAGTGEWDIDVDPISDYIYDVMYTGVGDIVISDSKGELFRRTGNYNGRILLNNIAEDGRLRIAGDGGWGLKAIIPIGLIYYNLISGNGDFVHLNIFTPVFVQGYNKIKISHEGDGEFMAQLRAGDADVESIVLMSGTGHFVECIDIPTSNPVYYLEIVTGGSWTIERVIEG